MHVHLKECFQILESLGCLSKCGMARPHLHLEGESASTCWISSFASSFVVFLKTLFHIETNTIREKNRKMEFFFLNLYCKILSMFSVFKISEILQVSGV